MKRKLLIGIMLLISAYVGKSQQGWDCVSRFSFASGAYWDGLMFQFLDVSTDFDRSYNFFKQSKCRFYDSMNPYPWNEGLFCS